MDNKILVIEDDPATLRLMDYSLRHEGYQVLTASNGLEGLRKVQDEKPDLVILDVMLPGIDGFEICHRLRSWAFHYATAHSDAFGEGSGNRQGHRSESGSR